MTGPNVIVTAGASGIGRAIAQQFLASGARVAVCDMDAAAIRSACAEEPALFGRVVDVASEAAVHAFVAEVDEVLGGIDAVINNAGIAGACASIENIEAADWIRSFDVNVHGAFYFIKGVTPKMKARKGGAIVNISTGSTFTLPVDRSDYIASKWAIEGFTRAAARELGPSNIRVNAIRPGFVDSARMRNILLAKAQQSGRSLAELEATFLEFISMRTKIQPEEIGDMAVFLVSDRARHVTGQLISVDGNIEWEN